MIQTFLKELRRLLTNADIRLMVLGAPILYGIVLTFAYTHGRVTKVPTGVVVNDSSNFTQTLLRQIDATEEVQLQNAYVSLPEADEAMKEGQTYSVLYIPKSFTKRRLRTEASPIYLSTNTSNFALSNPVMVGTATVTQVFSAANLMGLLRKTGQTKEKAFNLAVPIKLDTRQIFNPLLNYSFFFVPGLIYAILQQIILVGLCFSLTDEKDQQTWNPEKNPRKVLGYILGRSLPYGLINLVFSMLYIYMLLPWIHIHAAWDQFALILFLGFLFTTGASLMAFFLGLVFKDSITAIVALMFYSMPAFLISGLSWPSFNLSWPLRVLSWFIPITHFGDAIRRVLLEPAVGLYHVRASIVAMLVFILILLGVNAWILVRKKGQ